MSSFVKNPLQIAETIEKIFGDDLHAMRVLSLANGVVGVLDAAVLSIHAIGRGYAHATNHSEKHGVKQTDRMLSNGGFEMWSLFRPWAEFVVGERKEIVLALDWTEFDADVGERQEARNFEQAGFGGHRDADVNDAIVPATGGVYAFGLARRDGLAACASLRR